MNEIKSLAYKEIEWAGKRYNIIDLEKLDITELNLPETIRDVLDCIEICDNDYCDHSGTYSFTDLDIEILPGLTLWLDIDVDYYYQTYLDGVDDEYYPCSKIDVTGVNFVRSAMLNSYDESNTVIDDIDLTNNIIFKEL